jgi:sugar phosphate isomerase/epimerase
MNHMSMHPTLSKSYKGLFPFSIGATSFIYPDDYAPNVKLLGPYLENIELLLFESDLTGKLPSKKVIRELAGLANEFSLGYNIHLPTDISISSRDTQEQRLAVETVIKVAERVAPLSPATLTLHVPWHEDSRDENTVKAWQERVSKSLELILNKGIPARLISIENLDYPFELLDPIILELDLSVCLDCGHLILQGDDIHSFFKTYADQIQIIHIYGVQNNHFHNALDQLSDKSMISMVQLLARFKGMVSLEVFSFAHLETSLKRLEKYWKLESSHSHSTSNR